MSNKENEFMLMACLFVVGCWWCCYDLYLQGMPLGTISRLVGLISIMILLYHAVLS